MTYPLHPTERDHERFRDDVKTMGYPLEFNRCGPHEAYKDAITHMVWVIWWSVEKERQLLQNLNQSQGAEISRLINKLFEVTP